MFSIRYQIGLDDDRVLFATATRRHGWSRRRYRQALSVRNVMIRAGLHL